MKSSRRQVLRLAAGATVLPAVTRIAAAETYPARPVTLIVPCAPGALNDIVARLLSNGMSASLGQPVIVENVAGADGTVATSRVVRATPDGYTLIIGNWNTQVGNRLIRCHTTRRRISSRSCCCRQRRWC
jgi:tripartite-type tricarboxylate transporter receptor subunit TctC